MVDDGANLGERKVVVSVDIIDGEVVIDIRRIKMKFDVVGEFVCLAVLSYSDRSFVVTTR